MVFKSKKFMQEIPDEGIDTRINNQEKRDAQKCKDGKASVYQMVTFVLVMNIYNQSFVNEVETFVKAIDGVESVKGERKSNKLVVKGKVDPVKIQEKVQSFTNRKVELISQTRNETKDSKNNEQTLEKDQKSIHTDHSSSNKTEENLTNIKIKLNCIDCNRKLCKFLRNKGLEIINMDLQNDLVTVRGKVEAAEIRSYIKDQFKHKKNAEVVFPAKVELSASAEKNDGATKKQQKGKVTAAGDQKFEKHKTARDEIRRGKRISAVDDVDQAAVVVDIKVNGRTAAVDDKDENKSKVKDEDDKRSAESNREKRNDNAPGGSGSGDGEGVGGGDRGGRREEDGGFVTKLTNLHRVYPYGDGHVYDNCRPAHYVPKVREDFANMFSDENPHSYCSIT